MRRAEFRLQKNGGGHTTTPKHALRPPRPLDDELSIGRRRGRPSSQGINSYDRHTLHDHKQRLSQPVVIIALRHEIEEVAGAFDDALRVRCSRRDMHAPGTLDYDFLVAELEL